MRVLKVYILKFRFPRRLLDKLRAVRVVFKGVN